MEDWGDTSLLRGIETQTKDVLNGRTEGWGRKGVSSFWHEIALLSKTFSINTPLRSTNSVAQLSHIHLDCASLDYNHLSMHLSARH